MSAREESAVLLPKVVASVSSAGDNPPASAWLIRPLPPGEFMPAPLDHISSGTPMGANLIADGATFRVWAPNANAVYVLGDFNGRVKDDCSLLTKDAHGHWRGFIRGAKDRHRYMFHV